MRGSSYMGTASLRQLFVWPISGKVIYWIFASFVFGAYVVSLEAAFLESIRYYGPMRIFTTAYLANMVLPIQISIYVWFAGSVLHILGQIATKRIDRENAPISAGSLILSIWSVTVAISLSDVHVPWFVGYLQLTDATKLLVGMVSAFALAYVIYTPFVWNKNEISDDLRKSAVARVLPMLSEGLETDRALLRTHHVSLYVEQGFINIRGFCTGPKGKRASFTGRYTLPDLNLEYAGYSPGHEAR